MTWTRKADLVGTIERRDGSSCVWCRASGPGLSLEHVVPAARGGPRHLDNLVLACDSCNNDRAITPMQHWLEQLEREGGSPDHRAIEEALARAWSSPSFSVATAALFELCFAHQVTCPEAFAAVRPVSGWQMVPQPETFAAYYVEQVHRHVERRIEALQAAVDQRRALDRKTFALSYALRQRGSEQYASFALYEDRVDDAYRALKQERTVAVLQVASRRFPVDAQVRQERRARTIHLTAQPVAAASVVTAA